MISFPDPLSALFPFIYNFLSLDGMTLNFTLDLATNARNRKTHSYKKHIEIEQLSTGIHFSLGSTYPPGKKYSREYPLKYVLGIT